jgi:FkbM family methyltransferase
MGRITRNIKNIIVDNVPSFISRELRLRQEKNLSVEHLTYSQEGEDRVLFRLLEEKGIGFYVDIGAHHPVRFSNTFLFYLMGWKGINIDAMPGSMDAFHTLRPRDINLELPISSKEQLLKYYSFNEPALNTFSEEEAKKQDGKGSYKIIQTFEMETHPLVDVLDKYLEANQKIDVMSIDVEGLDFDVLKSNNWEKYMPEIILIESLRVSLERIHENEIFIFLKDRGYTIIAKTVNTLFFKREEISKLSSED